MLLSVEAGFEPTPFSLFLANCLHVRGRDRTAIDAGAGGGVLAIALAVLGVERVYAVERSDDAISALRANIALNGLSNRITVVREDIREFRVSSAVDLVVSNPPTIPENGANPAYVSGAGQDGLAFIEVLVEAASTWLLPKGLLHIVVSSIATHDGGLLRVAAKSGWTLSARNSMVVPVRRFYYSAYGERQLTELSEAGALIERDGELSERLTVVEMRHRNVWLSDEGGATSGGHNIGSET